MRTIVLLLASAILFSSCGGSNGDWVDHNVTEAGFIISLPTPIIKTKKNEVTPFGKKDRNFVRWKPSNFALSKFKLFEVSYVPCPAYIAGDSARMAAVLDSAVNMRINDFSEVDLIEYQSIELNGYPGRAFFYDAPKGNTLVSVKICIAGDKLYDLVAIVKKNYSTNAEVANFFNSFRLTR